MAWFDLNSVKPQPEVIRPLYLKMYLQTLRTEGYSIFVVRAAAAGGRLPAPLFGRLARDAKCKWHALHRLTL